MEEAEKKISEFVEEYNHQRMHPSIDNQSPLRSENLSDRNLLRVC
jgi:transposase InsO family protein